MNVQLRQSGEMAPQGARARSDGKTGRLQAVLAHGFTKTSEGGIAYLERPGPGPALVLLHGIGSNAGSFSPIFDVLPEEFRLIAWNAPGYRGSTPLDPPWPTAEDYAARLESFLHEIGVERCILLGHSLGTLIGAAHAARHPERVSRLVLAACAQGYGVPVGGSLPEGVAARITELKAQGPAGFAHARAPRLIHDPDRHAQAVARVEAAMAEVEPHGYAQAASMLASGDLSGTLARVTVPCGFIIGVEDRVTPEAQTLAAARAWERVHGTTAPIERIADAGHAVYIQAPAAFAAALRRLLEAPATGRDATALMGGSND